MPSQQRPPGMTSDIENMVKEYIGKALGQSPMESAWRIREESAGHLNKLMTDGKELQRVAKQFDSYWADDDDENGHQKDLSDHIQKFVQSSLQRAYQATQTYTDPARTSPPVSATGQKSDDSKVRTESTTARGPIPVRFDDDEGNPASERLAVPTAKRRKVKKGGVPVLFSVPRARRSKKKRFIE